MQRRIREDWEESGDAGVVVAVTVVVLVGVEFDLDPRLAGLYATQRTGNLEESIDVGGARQAADDAGLRTDHLVGDAHGAVR